MDAIKCKNACHKSASSDSEQKQYFFSEQNKNIVPKNVLKIVINNPIFSGVIDANSVLESIILFNNR